MDQPRVSGRVLAGAAVAALAAGWAWDAQRRESERRTTHRILVDLLLNALTADDPLTARHCRRVADLSYALAECCILPAEELAMLRVAALLHDVGKIDDRFWHIVHSREELTPEQRKQMQHHPDESARILEPLEALHPGIGAVVASHHERWDGNGYPAGLRGEQIPRGARIITLADVFDAMTQPRKYREPLSAEDAMDRLRKGAGKQFDPEMVDRLVHGGVIRQWMEIAREGLNHETSIPPGRKEMVAQSEPR